jgi:hypothetical protein
MGTNQMLLLILGAIVVGIAIAVAVTLFHDSAVNANRDALTNDLMDFASRSQQYYYRTVSNGGGGNSFTNITINMLTNNRFNLNGSYSILDVTPSQVILAGRGLYLVNNDSVEVHCTVTPVAYTFTVIH